jgi:hypothetical protein
VLKNKADAEDAEVIEVSDVPNDPEASRKRDLAFIASSRNLEPRKRLAAIMQAYLEDKITAGTMSFELVDLLPFDEGTRSKIEDIIREKYATLHPTHLDVEEVDAVEAAKLRNVTAGVKDRVI